MVLISTKLSEWSLDGRQTALPSWHMTFSGFQKQHSPAVSYDLPSAKAVEGLLKPAGVISLGANTGGTAPAC